MNSLVSSSNVLKIEAINVIKNIPELILRTNLANSEIETRLGRIAQGRNCSILFTNRIRARDNIAVGEKIVRHIFQNCSSFLNLSKRTKRENKDAIKSVIILSHNALFDPGKIKEYTKSEKPITKNMHEIMAKKRIFEKRQVSARMIAIKSFRKPHVHESIDNSMAFCQESSAK